MNSALKLLDLYALINNLLDMWTLTKIEQT